MSKYFLNANRTEKDGEKVAPKVYISEDGKTPIWINGLPKSTELAFHMAVSESFGSSHWTVDIEGLMSSDGVESSVDDNGFTVINLAECASPAKTLKTFATKVNNAQVDEELLEELRNM